MKKIVIYLLLSVLGGWAMADDTTSNPLNFEVTQRYEPGDTLKKVTFDINSDGVLDFFFTVTPANPDPVNVQAQSQDGDVMWWDVYVSVPNTNLFTISNSLEVDGGLEQGTGLAFNPDKIYIGNISEIQKYGFVTEKVKRSKQENTTIIYAYTWETDHFKQWKLAEFTSGDSNAIFDKYLTEANRTHVTITQIAP